MYSPDKAGCTRPAFGPDSVSPLHTYASVYPWELLLSSILSLSDDSTPSFEKCLPYIILYPGGQMTPSTFGIGILTGSPGAPRAPGSIHYEEIVSRALSLLRCLNMFRGPACLKPEVVQASRGLRGYPSIQPQRPFLPLFKLDSVAHIPRTLAERRAPQCWWIPWRCGAQGLAFLSAQSSGNLFIGKLRPRQAFYGFSVTRLGRLSPLTVSDN